MFHQQSWLARMEEHRSLPQLHFCSHKYSPTTLLWGCVTGPCLLHGAEAAEGVRDSHPVAGWHCPAAAPCPALARAGSSASALPNNRSCHTWLLPGASIKYPIHYVHSIPGGDSNKKLFWQKSWGNETQGRWGKRRRKIEIKNRKKHSTRWMEWVQNYLQLWSWKKKRRKWTPGHIVRLKVYLVCVSQKGQVIDLNHGLKKGTLFPTKKESQHLSSGKNKYLFIKKAFSFPAKSNEDHTQNLPPALDYQLFNHNQNIWKM